MINLPQSPITWCKKPFKDVTVGIVGYDGEELCQDFDDPKVSVIYVVGFYHNANQMIYWCTDTERFWNIGLTLLGQCRYTIGPEMFPIDHLRDRLLAAIKNLSPSLQP